MNGQLETIQQRRGWTPATALQLGRVSNLPTVWTNTLAAVVLAGGSLSMDVVGLLLVAMSLAYTGGMYLNDAFDRHIDGVERPERPIPSGRVDAREVFAAGFFMLALSVLLTGAAAHPAGQTLPAVLAALALSSCIVLYNCWHKGNPISPLLMGLCRLMVYVSCAIAVTESVPGIVLTGALVTLCYLIGLTYTAKQEKPCHVSTLWPLAFLIAPLLFCIYLAGTLLINLVLIVFFTVWTLSCVRLILRRGPDDISRAVVRMIAGISLVDAMLIASVTAVVSNGVGTAGMNGLTVIGFCLSCFLITLVLQRFVSGT